MAINACWPRDFAPSSGWQTAKRSEIIAQAFRPGNHMRGNAPRRGARVTMRNPIAKFQELVVEAHPVTLTGQFSLVTGCTSITTPGTFNRTARGYNNLLEEAILTQVNIEAKDEANEGISQYRRD